MTRPNYGRFGGKRAWRMHLDRVSRELEQMKDRALAHTDAKHAGTCYEGTILDAAFHVEQALKHVAEAVAQLS